MGAPNYSITPVQKTVTATNVALARGVRVLINANTGLVSVANATLRGSYVTAQAIAASGVGVAYPIQTGSHYPILVSENVAIGDALYSAADGKVSKTSTNTVLLGVALTAAVTNTLCTVEVQAVL